MKILFCANIFESGIVGPARFAESLLKLNEIYESEHEVKILTADVAKPSEYVFKMKSADLGFLRFFDFLFRGYAYNKGIQKIKANYKPDIILFGNAIYGLLPKLFNDKEIILGMVNDDHLLAINHKSFMEYRGGRTLLFLKKIEEYACKKLNGIVTCSDYLKNKVQSEYRIPKKKCFRLYQSINVQSIQYSEKKIDHEKEVEILFVKHRFDLGGLYILSEALKKLAKLKLKLTIIGPRLNKKKLILNWFKNNPYVKVNFMGPQAQNIVLDKLKTHHIFCVPSILEAQGLANIEAMASGTIVVSSDAGGIPEVLGNGTNGWISKAGDAGSLASALMLAINSTNEEKVGKTRAARAFAEKHFDVPVMLKNLLDIFNEQLKKAAHAA